MNSSVIVRVSVMLISTGGFAGCGDVDCDDYEAEELAALGKHLICPPDPDEDDEERVVFIGALGSDVRSVAYAINERGTVVGASHITAEVSNGKPRAFRWDSQSGMTELPTLGGEWSTAYDVNDHDEIVGHADLPDGTTRAVFWDADGEVHDLGTLGGTSSMAYALNNGGQVVGWTETDLFHPTFFIWDVETGMREISLDIDMQEGGWGNVNDINDDGVVVGSVSPGKFSDLPFKWTEAEGRVDLDTLGYGRGEAMAINGTGDIVGYMYNHSYDYETVGLKWTATEGTELATLPDSGPSTHVGAINDYGVMVGYARVPETGTGGATQWDTPTTPRALPLGPLFSRAYDINNRGQIVGAYGNPTADWKAFVWFPGE